MKRLIQKVVEINPYTSADKRRLQEYLDKKSSEGWEMCGQVGLFHIFKRWEEVPNVVEGGSGYGGYQPTFNQPYNSYNRPYQPQTPYFPTGGNSYGTSYNSYSPSSFGVRVNENDNDKKRNIFDEDE